MNLTNYPDETEATKLAFILAEAAERRQDGPIKDVDGVVRDPSLDRDGNRLYIRGESEVWWDISDVPVTDHDDEAELPHEVIHVDHPMTEFHGWHRAAAGWLLVSSDGTSWTPEAYAPDDRD